MEARVEIAFWSMTNCVLDESRLPCKIAGLQGSDILL